jgi:hypothetical protein
MTKLAGHKIELIEDHGVEIVKVGRSVARYWRERSGEPGEPVFCGFYWQIARRGYVISEAKGPFRTWSAAVQDAFKTVRQEGSSAKVFRLTTAARKAA